MKKLLIAILLPWPLPARALAGKVLSDQVQLKPSKEIHVVVDRGQVTILPSSSSVMTYQVEFVPSQSGLFGPKDASAESYKNSDASFRPDADTLEIRTGDNLSAQVKIYLPADQSLDALLLEGNADIGALTGHLKVFVKNGTLRYDSAALPSNSCVLAIARHGTSSNSKESDCMEPNVLLRVTNGYVSVR